MSLHLLLYLQQRHDMLLSISEELCLFLFQHANVWFCELLS